MPEDITTCDTHVLAINGNRQAGQVSNSIKAFAPLVAQLEVPRFLIEGDSSQVLAQAMNHEDETKQVTIVVEVAGKQIEKSTENLEDFWQKNYLFQQNVKSSILC